MRTVWGKLLGAAAVALLAAGTAHAQAACSDTDLNGDGVTDGLDVEIFEEYLGATVDDPAFDPTVDLNGDGAVTMADFNILLSCR